MAAGDTITRETDVGSDGIWRMVISQTSQNQTAWTTRVRVRLYMKNTSPVGSYNNTGPAMSINGPGSHDWSDTHVPFNVAAGATDLVADQSFDITHATNGTLSATFTATLGTTGTGTFGSGGSVSGTFVADSLATVPGTPTKPVITLITDTSLFATFSDNASDGGIDVDDRRIYYNTTNTTVGALYVTSDGSTSVTGLTPGGVYYLWSRTHNDIGWSAYSAVAGPVTMLKVPDAPSAPAVTNVKQTTCTFSFTDGANNGSAIIDREIAYSLTEGGTKTSTSTGAYNSGTLTGLPPGSALYIWARTKNAVGWSAWSLYTLIHTVAGAYVWVSGVRKEAIPYVWLDSDHAFHLLEPNIRTGGAWKQATR